MSVGLLCFIYTMILESTCKITSNHYHFAPTPQADSAEDEADEIITSGEIPPPSTLINITFSPIQYEKIYDIENLNFRVNDKKSR